MRRLGRGKQEKTWISVYQGMAAARTEVEERMLEAGRIVGKYEIVRPLGAGGEGCVYLAEDSVLLRPVALKRIGEESTWDAAVEKGAGNVERKAGNAAEEAVLREAGFLRDLQHPMLPVVYDLFYRDGWYLVMEYIEGVSLHNYIAKTGIVEEEQGRVWAEALLSIMEYLHTRKPPVIYRDLKPENIMVCADKSLRLVDLGAAWRKGYGGDTDGRMALTPGYGAPEQFGKGRKAYADERSDIFAFGRVLYYMLTGADPGKPPYGSIPIRVYHPLLGDDLESVIQKCTRESPGERYQMVEEIRRDLSVQGARKRRRRRENFLRHMEKKVWLTQKRTVGL